MAVPHFTLSVPLGQATPSPTQPISLPPPDHEALVLIKTTGYNLHGIILRMTTSYQFQSELIMGNYEWSDKPLLLLTTVKMVNGLMATYKSAVRAATPTTPLPSPNSPSPFGPTGLLAPQNIPLEIFFVAGLRSDYRQILINRHQQPTPNFGPTTSAANWTSQVLCMIPAEWYPEFAPAQYRTASGWYRPNGEGPFWSLQCFGLQNASLKKSIIKYSDRRTVDGGIGGRLVINGGNWPSGASDSYHQGFGYLDTLLLCDVDRVRHINNIHRNLTPTCNHCTRPCVFCTASSLLSCETQGAGSGDRPSRNWPIF